MLLLELRINLWRRQKQCCRFGSASFREAGSGSASNGKARAEEAHNEVLEDLRTVVVDSHHFDEEAHSDCDLHQSERSASRSVSASE